MVEPLDPKRLKRVEVNALHPRNSGSAVIDRRYRLQHFQ
jgi:hypothetical protein